MKHDELNELRELVERWERDADRNDGGYTDGLRDAARDLRELLAWPPAGPRKESA